MYGIRLYVIVFLFILTPATILGQNIQGLFTSKEGDTIYFAEDSIYLRLNTEENILLGTGYFKQKSTRLIVNTTIFPFKKSNYSFIYMEKHDSIIEFCVKNTFGEPLPNVNITQMLNNLELGETTKTDIEGRAIMNANKLCDIKSFVTNKIGYNSLEVPFLGGGFGKCNITLESADVLYFENEKLIFHYKYEGNIIKLILHRIKNRGRIDKELLIEVRKST